MPYGRFRRRRRGYGIRVNRKYRGPTVMRGRGFRRRRYGRRSRIADVMPRTKCVKQRYMIEKVMAPDTPDVMVYKQFRANDVLDPEVAIGGHSAMGTDQLQVFYKYHTVIGSTIRVTPVINSTAALPPVIYGIVLHDQVEDPTPLSYHCLMENNWTTKRRCALTASHQNAVGYQQSAGLIQHMSFSTKKFFHTHPLGDIAYSGTSSSSPSEQAYFTLFAYLAPGNATPSEGIYFTIQIEYIVVYHDPYLLPTSGEDLTPGTGSELPQVLNNQAACSRRVPRPVQNARCACSDESREARAERSRSRGSDIQKRGAPSAPSN